MISFRGTSSYCNKKAESWQNLGSFPFHCTMIVVDPMNAIKNPLFKTAYCLVDLMSNGWNRTHVNENCPGRWPDVWSNVLPTKLIDSNCLVFVVLITYSMILGTFRDSGKLKCYQFQLPPLVFLFSWQNFWITSISMRLSRANCQGLDARCPVAQHKWRVKLGVPLPKRCHIFG